MHGTAKCAAKCIPEPNCTGYTWFKGARKKGNTCQLKGAGCEFRGVAADKGAHSQHKVPRFYRRTKMYDTDRDSVKPAFTDMAIETPECDLPGPQSSGTSTNGGFLNGAVLRRNIAPLNSSQLTALSAMLAATEWPDNFAAHIHLEASEAPCRNIIPIRGDDAPSSYDSSFLYDPEAVRKRFDTLWKRAVMAGPSSSQVGGNGQVAEDAVNMGPSANGTIRSPTNGQTCITKHFNALEREGFGGEYFYMRMLVEYAVMNNMWVCHHAPHKFGVHSAHTNVTLSDELMGLTSVRDPTVCKLCKQTSKLALAGYFYRRLQSQDRGWLRADGFLRLRQLSKVAQMQSKGLNLRTCQFKTGRRNVAVHIRRGDVHQSRERYMSYGMFKNVMLKLQEIYHNEGGGNPTTGRLLFHIYAETHNDRKLFQAFGPKSEFGQDDVVFHTSDRDLECYACMVTAEALITSDSQFSFTASFVRTGPTFTWKSCSQTVDCVAADGSKKTKGMVLDSPEKQFGFRGETDETLLQCLAEHIVMAPLVAYPPPS